MDRRPRIPAVTDRPASAEELAATIRAAHDAGRALRIVGRGTWLSAGRPVRDDARRVDLSRLSGIVEYVPGDLTLTARAGTTLAELDAVTAAHGQWCPLLAWGTDGGTIGATFATATTGPLRAAFGAPRDLALGLEFIDGTGARVRPGGRVVKNVAGFDLTRLLVGSWGTLGAITEVSVRLRARPALDETWALTLADDAAHEQADAFRRGPLAPMAFEALDDVHSRALGLSSPRVLVRLGGNGTFVAASRAALQAIGHAEPCDTALWAAFRALDPRPRTIDGQALSQPLARRVKQQFDPRHILNPGIFGEDAS
jgi:glycolate oxidase FAD binding subunit